METIPTRDQASSRGENYLASLRDGRRVYIDGEPVADLLQHPQTRPMAQSLARLLDHPVWSRANQTQWSPLWSPSREPDDLPAKGDWYRSLAALTGGLMGRSPDFLAAVVTAWMTGAEHFGDHAEHVRHFHAHCRRNDIVLSHAISDPPAARDGELNEAQLKVVERHQGGITVSGIKMLATLGPFADYLLVYPFRRLNPAEAQAALCFAVPVSAPGLRFHLRPALYGESSFADARLHPLDESDAIVEFDRVFIPDELVFIDGSTQTANELRSGTALTTHAWHQAAARGWAKTQMIADLASRCAGILGKNSDGARKHLGEIQAQANTLRALLDFAERHGEPDRDGRHLCCNHSAVSTAVTHHAAIASSMIDRLAQILGSALVIRPGNGGSGIDPGLLSVFYGTGIHNASDEHCLQLAYELTASTFGTRQTVYEQSFVGPPDLVRANELERYRADAPDVLSRFRETLDQGVHAHD